MKLNISIVRKLLRGPARNGLSIEEMSLKFYPETTKYAFKTHTFFTFFDNLSDKFVIKESIVLTLS